MDRPLTTVEQRKIQDGTLRETVMQESFWRMRPDGIAVLPPTENKMGIFCILCSAISTVIGRQGWRVDQVSFITGARSLDKQDFRKN